MKEQDVFLVDGLRTPFGAFGGALHGLSAPKLASPLLAALIERNRLDPNLIDEVILGQVIQAGSGQAPARQALIGAKIPYSVPAMTINKVCGSGLKSAMLAADRIRLGESRCALTGGMESMSGAPFAVPSRFAKPLGPRKLEDLLLLDGLMDPYSGRHMGELTEEVCKERGITREEQDAYAIRSYERAQAAQSSGLLAEEILPLNVGRPGKETLLEQDEEPGRVDFTKIESLQPAFSKQGGITAANASTLSDGAAALLIMEGGLMRELGLTPLARILSYDQESLDPARFSEAPPLAMTKAAERAGISLEQIDLFEINEAFSAVPLLAIKQLGLEPERVNVNGGAVSLGHPLAASGARLALTLAMEMRRRGAKLGMASLCIGGGGAVAMLLEGV